MKKQHMISRIEDLISKSKDKNDLQKSNRYFGGAIGFIEACSRMNIINLTEVESFHKRLLNSENEKQVTQ